MDKEYRIYQTNDLRVEGEGPDKKIFGYAAKFNSESPERWGWKEVIEPGFFRKALLEPDRILGLLNHDENFILSARGVDVQTLSVREDSVGLPFEMRPADTRRNNDWVISPIERKELAGCSFGFTMYGRGIGYELEEDAVTGQVLQRLLPDGCMRLYDLGPVAFPFYSDTSVGMRSFRSATEARIAEFRKDRKIRMIPENHITQALRKARARSLHV